MPLASGEITLISVESNSAQLTATSAAGGTPPYTQQWKRNSVNIPGETALTLNDKNLIPNTEYYYTIEYTDSASTKVETPPTYATTTPIILSQNQFQMAAYPGLVDLKVGLGNVVSAQIDETQTVPLYPGARVYTINNSNGIPTVAALSATKMPSGYIVYDPKSESYNAGDRCEIARNGTCIWLYATTPIVRGAQVCIDESTEYGVQALSNTALPIVGEAFDQSTEYGKLIRVILNVPSYEYDDSSVLTPIIPITQILTGSGTYTPTSSPRPPLYIRLRLWGAGGGGSGSAKGVTAGEGGDGENSTFDGTNFIAQGGEGGALEAGGSGGGYSIGLPLVGSNFNGQNGSYNHGTFYDAAFATAPYTLQNYLTGGAGGNSMFAGAGVSSITSYDAVANTGCGGAGANINALSSGNPSSIFNSGCGGGGGGYIDYILQPIEATYYIGQGGAPGTAGTFGMDGGAGANGGGIITEYFQ